MNTRPPVRLAATIYRPPARPGTSPHPVPQVHIRVCPECAGPVTHAGGCLHCPQCGWGRCG